MVLEIMQYPAVDFFWARGFSGRHEGLLSIQDVTTMKRILSTLLILIFGLGPLLEALPASAESSLPACCRRHGAHHCAMSAVKTPIASEAAPGAAYALTAPMHCRSFPGYADAYTTQISAMAVSATCLPILLAQAHSPAASRVAALLSQIRTRAGRAPPSSLLD